jgi:uncharacterized protein
VSEDSAQLPHLPRAAPIDAYGKGGFRFAQMSHRGSLICLPSGIWASPISAPDQITEAALGLVFANASSIDHCLIGTGVDMVPLAPALREVFRAHRIVVEAMATGAAVRTYNILLGERRRIAALLIAVP